MKRLPALTALCSFFLFMGTSASLVGEAPSVSHQQVEEVLTVAKEVQVQQVAIAENQAKIDAKLASIADQIRVARIYATRTGGKK